MRTAVVVTLAIALSAPVLARAEEITLTPDDDLVAELRTLAPDDIVILEDGTYELSNEITGQWQGGSGARVEVRGAAGARPVIVAPDNRPAFRLTGSHFSLRRLEITGGDVGVRLEGVDRATLDDLYIHGVESAGIVCDTDGMDCTQTTIQFVEIADTEAGMRLGCGPESCTFDRGAIRGNLVHELHDDGAEAIRLGGGSAENDIIDNVVWGGPSHGIRVSGIAGGTVANGVRRNLVVETQGDGIRVAGQVGILNNIVVDTEGNGIHSRTDGAFTPGDVQVFHNTVYIESGGDCFEGAEWPIEQQQFVMNNAFFCPGSNAIDMVDGAPEADMRNNLVDGDVFGGGDYVVVGSAEEEFVAPEMLDLFPAMESALVDASAIDGGLNRDFDGTLRDEIPDVGAYEWTAQGPAWQLQEALKGGTARPGDGDGDGGDGGGGGQNAGTAGGGGGAFPEPTEEGCCRIVRRTEGTSRHAVWLGVLVAGLAWWRRRTRRR